MIFPLLPDLLRYLFFELEDDDTEIFLLEMLRACRFQSMNKNESMRLIDFDVVKGKNPNF